MFDGMHNGWMWGMPWIWWVVGIILIVGVVWAISRVQVRQGSPPPRVNQRETPLEALQRRYADGEISTEEYEERKRHLQRDE